MFPRPAPAERQTDGRADGRTDRQSAQSLGTQRRFQHRAILTNVFINVRSLQGDFLLEPSELNYPKALCRAAWIRRREAVSQKRQPWTETVEELGARLRDICDHINTHIDAEGLCKGLPSRAQNLGSNPEGSALFLLGMQNSIAHALPRPALEGCCGDMWGVKLKAGPEPA